MSRNRATPLAYTIKPGAPSPRAMRVCEVTPYGVAQVSGVTRVVVDLAGGIGKRGHHVSIIAPSPSPSSSTGEYDVWPVKLAGPFRNVRFSRAVASLLLRRKAD